MSLAFDHELVRRLRLLGQVPKALEKELQWVAQHNYALDALDLEEAQAGLNCLAIPLYLNGEFVAVAGISGGAGELTKARLAHFALQFLTTK